MTDRGLKGNNWDRKTLRARSYRRACQREEVGGMEIGKDVVENIRGLLKSSANFADAMQLNKAENLREESPRSSVNEGICTVLHKVTWRWIESGTIAEVFIGK